MSDAPARGASLPPADPRPDVRPVVFVCHGPSCSERGSPDTCARLRELLQRSSARLGVQVCETTCMDNCATGPNVLISDEGAVRTGQVPQNVEGLLLDLVVRMRQGG